MRAWNPRRSFGASAVLAAVLLGLAAPRAGGQIQPRSSGFATSQSEESVTPPPGAERPTVAPGVAAKKSGQDRPTVGVVTVPVDAETYVVGPGDVFQLTLSGRVSFSDQITIGPEGDLLIPGTGPVRLTGLTLVEARRRVLRAVEPKFRGVRIDFQLARVRLMRVYLTGDVKEPGAALIAATSRLSEALPASALLGGASQRNIDLRRRDGTRLIGDMELFNRTGHNALNPFLQDGDIVHVPTAVEFIDVSGAVARPGRFELGPADSLRTLLDLAGGPLPSAQADRCLLVRWSTPIQAESLWFALDDVYAGTSNPPLRDGDRAFIFFTSRFHVLEQAGVYGEVENPGVYPLVTGQSRLSHLIRAAHGFLSRADLSTIRVFRAARSAETDPEFDRLIRLSRDQMTSTEYEILRAKLAARREDYRVDWFRLEQSPELDVLMRDGDVVRVDPLIASVRVEGEVRRPGIVDFEPRRSVDAYIRLAGGYSNRAAGSKVRITRAVTGQSLRSKDVQEVAPGDLIWVPERADATVWQHLQTLVTVAAQVATVIIAVRR